MKPRTYFNGILLAGAAGLLALGLLSFDQLPSPGQTMAGQADTVPVKQKSREKNIRDLDDVLDEMDRADLQLDLEKMQQELRESLKELDMDKIRLEIDKAMKEVDMEKIKKEIQESMAKIDLNKIREEIDRSLKEVDFQKIQREIQESVGKIDWSKMQAELDKVKNVDMKKVQEEMKQVAEEMKGLQPKLEKELEKARLEIDKAKEEIREYKTFADGLEKDGLIDRKKGYSLRHKNGVLTINGEKAPEATYNKYRGFLDKHPSFHINKTDDDFDMDLD